MNLAGLIWKSGVRSLAVVGTAKNAGKTVTMNYLAHELSAKGLSVGLVSSGRDGETTDTFTGEPKPSVVPPEGSWVATAEGVLGEAGGLLEIADVSERRGLLGRLVLGRVLESYPLELVGPQSVRELGDLVRRLLSLGADIVLVDGALDRVAAANPKVTEAAVLSTGASSGDNLNAIAERIGFLVWLWSRPRPGEIRVRALARAALDKGLVSFLDEGAPAARETPYRTCLGFEEEILSLAGDAAYVVVPGAVSRKFLSEAGSWPEREDFGVIASSAVSVFTTEDPGVPIFVDEEMRLLAVTVNPVSYRGISYDPSQMVAAVTREIGRGSRRGLPVFDVVSGEMSPKEVGGVAVG